MLSDPIADMLTRIRNAIMAGHSTVAIPHSKTKLAIAQILKDEGYVADVGVEEGTPASTIVITLKYWGSRRERRPVISNVKRVSKPGRRVYVGKDNIPWVLSGMGISILTTPRGIMTGQQARRQGVGGEVLCYVW
ncbi:MAG: 30S ribosomal protein S8 [Anaerolineae bacterium]|nr:30S ribosomal protein S8 [Anaerolineae bacterium]MEB2287457.1 30S ribosomal protein S8 [Anaerolineae bacterium]